MNKTFREVEFSGKNGEYFRLCLVNFFLTVITLGIYSPWAMVRNKQYLYGHTRVDGHAFGYHGDPIKILKSRIIAFILLLIYFSITFFFPETILLFSVVLLCFLPWIIVQNLKFSNRMMSYRNVRFDFSGQKKGGLLTFIIYPVLSVFTLYLALPLVIKKQFEYLFDNKQYGKINFKSHFKTVEFYKVFGLAAAIIIPVIILAISVMSSGAGIEGRIWLLIFIMAGGFMLANIVTSALLWKQLTHNITLPNVAKFDTTVSITGMFVLVMTNFLIVVFTLGLGAPIAVMRQRRYMCENTQYQIEVGIEDIVSNAKSDASALGEELNDLFDLGIAENSF